MTDLNATERRVLAELIQSSAGNGHDFGFTDDVRCVREAQVPGYITQLVNKGYIKTYREEGQPMFVLTPKGRQSQQQEETE